VLDVTITSARRKTMVDWKQVVEEDPEKAANLVRGYVAGGNVVEASNGLLAMIEAMSVSDERELTSFTMRIALHMYKLWLMPHSFAVEHWIKEIETFRDQLDHIVSVVPSLRQKIPSALDKAKEIAKRRAYVTLGRPQKPEDNLPDFSFEDILGAKDLRELLQEAVENHDG
jgi:hypothetical protein